MAHQLAVENDWKDKMQIHKVNLLSALSTENLAYVEFRSALALQTSGNPSLALMATGASDQVATKIKEINAGTAKTQEDNFNEFKNEAESLKKSNPDQSTWKQLLDKKRDELKEKSSKAIDDSFQTATNYIAELPPAQQESAANVFSAGADIVAKTVEYVFGKIKELVSSIVDFLKGVWDKVVTTYNAVKGFISSAVSAIFGSSSMIGGGQRTHASDDGMFEASLTWKAPISMGVAATIVDATCETLDFVIEQTGDLEPKYTIVSKSICQLNDTCAAKVLFKVANHAGQLEKHFRGLFRKQSSDLMITWTLRGNTSSLESDAGKPTSDCSFELTWARGNRSQDEVAVEATLNYLQTTISTAVDGKYVVQTGPIEKTNKIWVAEIICREVPTPEATEVSETIRKVLSEELKRQVPLKTASNVPTPNRFGFQKLEAETSANGV